MKSPLYLVPFDFSPVSENAMRFAVDMAAYNKGTVMVLHIVSKKSERQAARDKMQELTKKFSQQEQELISTKVLIGDIYEDIAKASEILSASLIVMGTHGAKGIQKIFGSHALRLVSSTSTPFIIIRSLDHYVKMDTIVMPFNFEKESIQIATVAGYIAKQFNASIHLVGYHDKDEWLEGKMKTNQIVLRKFFIDHDVKHEIVNLDRSKPYEKSLISYAQSVSADLFAASAFTDSVIPSVNSFIQELIENSIPLLTINAEELTNSSGYSFLIV